MKKELLDPKTGPSTLDLARGKQKALGAGAVAAMARYPLSSSSFARR